MNRSELGAALRALRQASGTAAKTVARSSVMSASKLSKIETGKLSPSADDVDTRMRLMALHLAFDGLDAAEMVSEAYEDNPASNAVSRRLGYTANGSRITAREERSVVENSYRMTRVAWDARPADLRTEIMLEGVSSVRQLFGIDQPTRSTHKEHT